MSNYDVNNIAVSSLLASIKNGEIAIPEIQRPFVWDSTKVRDLIDSLYQNYPVGYIIVWQNPDVRLKDGTMSIGKKVLIDGQQRITALTAAIVGQEVVGSDYKKKRIVIAFNPLEEQFDVATPATSNDVKYISDISEIFNPSCDVYGFVEDYCEKNGLEIKEEKSKISKVITRLKSIENNNLGVINLSHELDIEQVTDIFIRINSKGVVLSQADFAMSKISSNEIYGGNITRKIIDYFCHLMQSPADYELIKNNDVEFSTTSEFDKIKWVVKENEDIYVPDYTDVLRVAFTYKFVRGRLSDLVALLSGRDFETREFKDEIAETSFEELRDAVLSVVNETNFKRYLMILKSIGIEKASLVRSQNVLNFGYTLFIGLRSRGIDSNVIEKTVRRWLVATMLTGRYSGSPESSFDYDIKRFMFLDNPLEYLEQYEAGSLSDAFWEHSLVDHLNTSVASSPYYNVFLMAQVNAHDKGFLSEQIEIKTMLEERGDIHHLFPKKYLMKNGITNKSLYNQIANYAYLQTEINIKISDDAPNEYMSVVLGQIETGQGVYGGITNMIELKKNLEMNCIPEGFESMTIDDYPRFLDARRKLMAKKIKAYYESLK
ncbi:GmrSD restriction endonuclease domain-containing protein [Butyrivibrio sp. NC3005]|uniref:GmrSD restriction endonuclease domain-containing protein n=1 Tax=Butyrivibrio sp. NC3005 TaxID=1280685 RepID=UPI0004207BD5|nr:DUF262 domain-containing protein [Butyrivibrio sp. NC3005]